MSKKNREAFRQGQVQNHMATPRVPEGPLLNREAEKVPPALESLGAKPVELPRAYVLDSRCDNPKCRDPRSRLRATKVVEDGRIALRTCRACGKDYQAFERVRK